MSKHSTIWKSYGMLNLKELQEEKQAAVKFLTERYPETEQTKEVIQQKIYEHIDINFEDETSNLDRQLAGRILCIADLGLWNGRRQGYKVLGNNLKEVLTCGIGCDEKEVYCNAYDVCAQGYHHDGSNSVIFREIKEEKDIDILLEKLYAGEATRKDITRYTKSLRPYIKSLYGI